MNFDQLIMEISNNPNDPDQWHEWINNYSYFERCFEAGIRKQIKRRWGNESAMSACVCRDLDKYVFNALDSTPKSVLNFPVNGEKNFLNRGISFGFVRAIDRARSRCRYEGDMPGWFYDDWNGYDE